MRTLHYETDLCVVGGGMAGLCCAIAAARQGIGTVLVQDRAVLGGNASSEIRMWICGCHGQDNRETGIVEEILLENFYQNPGLKYSLWDSVLYQKAIEEKNLTLLLNSSCLDAEMEGDSIRSVKAWQSNAETFHVVKARYFADCSGDSILSALTGAAVMYGREAKADYNETIPPDAADRKTMGMSCLFQIRETDHPVKFTPPPWAYLYESDDQLPMASHDTTTNFWWIELGGEWDAIHDTDRCRDELIKICYGVWDHMKNRGDHGVENWEMEWIGLLPGKRESRRYVGKTVVTQRDVEAGGHYEDIVAYAGWTMDDHFSEGFYYRGGHPTIYHPAPTPWGLPLRCMMARDIRNLTFAGRNISVTHAALSSSRVMATCAILGQALGCAVAQAVQTETPLEQIHIPTLQATLMDQDCYIPWHSRELSPLTLQAECSSQKVRSGLDRGEENCWIGGPGDQLEYRFAGDTLVSEVRIIFDSDLNRDYQNMPCSYPLVEKRFRMPETMMKRYRLAGTDGEGREFTLCVEDNRRRYVRHNLGWRVRSLRLIPLESYGSPELRIFSFEVK